MKAPLPSPTPRFLVPLAFIALTLGAQAAPKCDQIAQDVRQAITSDPAKTLMIVEDALVINESCACEIVRAAIEASKADAALKQEIVQTALAVAPKMAPVITECAGIEAAAAPAVPTAVTEVTDSGKSGKDGKSVLPVAPPAPVEEDFYYIPRDIRGIYLIAPGGVGLIGNRTVEEVCDDDKKTHKKRRITHPISRSVAAH
jgi:hypothetical protein